MANGQNRRRVDHLASISGGRVRPGVRPAPSTVRGDVESVSKGDARQSGARPALSSGEFANLAYTGDNTRRDGRPRAGLARNRRDLVRLRWQRRCSVVQYACPGFGARDYGSVDCRRLGPKLTGSGPRAALRADARLGSTGARAVARRRATVEPRAAQDDGCTIAACRRTITACRGTITACRGAIEARCRTIAAVELRPDAGRSPAPHPV